jgi:beta-glucanase (GH16 family)
MKTDRRAALAGAATVLIGLGGCAEPREPAPRAPAAPGSTDPVRPAGQTGDWRLVFSDEFDGTELDRSRWTDVSSAEADAGHGNKGNQQLEWNQAANCVVSGGELTLTARREAVTSPSGTSYDWTSCLLTTAPSVAFRYGYVEERAVLPAEKGFWPAFWTWQAPTVDTYVETDVYEVYSANRHELRLTQHSGHEGECRWRAAFDPAAGWHTYAASIEPSGTTWYVDGAEVCRTDATSDGDTNIISNLAVHAADPPDAGVDTAVKRVDYVRVWQRR